jgi:hypothetical protein
MPPAFSIEAYLAAKFARVKRRRSDLRDYQRFAVRWLHDNPYSALLVDMGLGKTVVVLTLLEHLLSRFRFRKCLIVAPLKVANEVWPNEIVEWQHTAPLTFALLTGDPAQRLQAMQDPAALHIINREALPWLVAEWGERWPYDVLIYDESSRLGDHGSVGFAALKSVRHRLRRLHELTATPAAQSYMKLFSQVWLLDRGARLGSFITHFRTKYFDHNQYSRTWTLKEGADQQIEALIWDVCLVMRRKDYLDMADPVIRPVPVRLRKSEMAKYQQFEREFILEVAEEKLIEAPTRAVLTQKLLQLSAGAVYDDERTAHWIHDHKIAALRQLREEAPGHNFMVAYWFKSSLERLQKAFPAAVTMDRAGKAVKRWNEGRIEMLLVHPQSAGHGLNLQFGGHHLAIFDIFHSLELFQQLVKRLDRPGQQETVLVHLLTAVGTLDEVVVERLRVLESAQEALFRRLKSLRAAAERRAA